MATWVQILDEADCISHKTNTIGKDVNPIILPQPIEVGKAIYEYVCV